jgi:hypothetical protein
MRITLQLENDLHKAAQREARQRGRTLASLAEEGLRRVLARPRTGPMGKRVVPPVSRPGGVRPGADLNNSAALLDIMEDPYCKA